MILENIWGKVVDDVLMNISLPYILLNIYTHLSIGALTQYHNIYRYLTLFVDPTLARWYWGLSNTILKDYQLDNQRNQQYSDACW